MARPCGELAIAHGAQLPAERLLGDRDAELLKVSTRPLAGKTCQGATNFWGRTAGRPEWYRSRARRIVGSRRAVLSLLDLAAILLTLSALFGWLNHKFLPLPHTIGLLLMSVVTSLILVLVDVAFPEQHLFAPLTAALLQIDFSAVVMNGMLAFLLFAGTLHVDLGKLRSRAFPVALLATLGTIISTVLVGAGIWELARLLGNPMPLPWALVFGALISPTDPVAVLSTLKNVKVPPSLEVEMQGEALFNDGVGIVLFTILLRFALDSGGDTSPSAITGLLLLEAGGGLLLGLATGYVAYRGMQMVGRLSDRSADFPRPGDRNVRARPETAHERAACGGGRRPVDRRPRPALRHE